MTSIDTHGDAAAPSETAGGSGAILPDSGSQGGENAAGGAAGIGGLGELGGSGSAEGGSGHGDAGGDGVGGVTGSAGGLGGKGATTAGSGNAATGGSGVAGGGTGGSGNAIGGSGGTGVNPLTPFTFLVDDSRRQSGLIGYDPLTLAVTDQAGITWTLQVRAGARLLPEMISMAPITAISNAAGASIPVSAGVVFEPDGLQLAIPATLTARIPNASDAVMVRYSADGQNVSFADAVLAGDTCTSNVYHFSGEGVALPSDPAALCALARALAVSALATLQVLVGLPQPDPLPVPPTTNYDCPSTDGQSAEQQAIDTFVKVLNQPEMDAIENYLDMVRWRALACGTDESSALREVLPALDRLAERVGTEASQYGSDTARIPAVVHAMLSIARQQQLLGGQTGATLTRAAALMDVLANALLKRLRNHELEVAQTTLAILRQDALLGGSAGQDLTPFYDALAMTVSENETTASTPGPSTSTHAEILLRQTGNGYATTDGTATYTASSFSGAGTTGSLVSPLTFPLIASLVLTDVCDTANPFSATVTLRQLGAAAETWSICGGTVCNNTAMGPMTASFNVVALAAYTADTGASYVFEMPATSRVPAVAQQSFSGSGTGNATANIEVIVTHTPQ